jgi:hypothetical protein
MGGQTIRPQSEQRHRSLAIGTTFTPNVGGPILWVPSGTIAVEHGRAALKPELPYFMRTRPVALALASLLFLPAVGAAQTPNAQLGSTVEAKKVDPAKEQAIRNLLEVTHTAQTLLDGMMELVEKGTITP